MKAQLARSSLYFYDRVPIRIRTHWTKSLSTIGRPRRSRSKPLKHGNRRSENVYSLADFLKKEGF